MDWCVRMRVCGGAVADREWQVVGPFLGPIVLQDMQPGVYA